jgi:copper(I)-binding protein
MAEPDAARASRTRVTKRGLQIALGVVWLLDGALQLQPFMFGSGFADQVLGSAADGQPGWVAGGVHWAAGVVGAHPVVWNALFAAVQLAIGAGLLVRPLVRFALVASVGWALGVWYFGEGLGGIASGHASLLTGAPGAVLLYALLAAIAWPPTADGGWTRHDSSGPPARWTPVAWALLWVGGALVQALPGQNTADDLAGALNADAPTWQAGLNQHIADHVRVFGSEDNWLLLAVLVAIGLLALGGRRQRAVAGWAGAVAATVFWMLGQGFGNLFSGHATDPNTGPLLVLLALALLAVEPAPVAEPEFGQRPAWRTSALAGVSALAVAAVALVQWGTTRTPVEPPQLTITAVYTPAGADAPVYFTLTNSGGADTLLAAGTEFQTAAAAHGASVCGNAACTDAGTVPVPAHSTLVFGPGGPHVVVHGLGRLAMGHQPLQVTLTFAKSGVTHVLSPIGSPSDLTENDIMTYGFMGGRDPGMGGMDMPGMTTGH